MLFRSDNIGILTRCRLPHCSCHAVLARLAERPLLFAPYCSSITISNVVMRVRRLYYPVDVTRAYLRRHAKRSFAPCLLSRKQSVHAMFPFTLVLTNESLSDGRRRPLARLFQHALITQGGKGLDFVWIVIVHSFCPSIHRISSRPSIHPVTSIHPAKVAIHPVHPCVCPGPVIGVVPSIHPSSLLFHSFIVVIAPQCAIRVSSFMSFTSATEIRE